MRIAENIVSPELLVFMSSAVNGFQSHPFAEFAL
jgi:hypothetical protein